MSIIRQISPQFRFVDNRRKLWNPVSKKSLEILPEERIRLQCVEYLHHIADIPYSRMKTELPIRFHRDGTPLRADILTYGSDFKPYLLVECKAPHIKLNEKTAIQISRYNQKINCAYIWITNGLVDFFFDTVKQSFVQPENILTTKIFNPTHEYLVYSGFCNSNSSSSLFDVIQHFQTGCNLVYMNVEVNNESVFDLRHYYRVFEFNGIGWAASFINDSTNSNHLVGIRTDKKDQDALLIIKLHQTFPQKVYIIQSKNFRVLEYPEIQERGIYQKELTKSVHWPELLEYYYQLAK